MRGGLSWGCRMMWWILCRDLRRELWGEGDWWVVGGCFERSANYVAL